LLAICLGALSGALSFFGHAFPFGSQAIKVASSFHQFVCHLLDLVSELIAFLFDLDQSAHCHLLPFHIELLFIASGLQFLDMVIRLFQIMG